ncbi:MAG: glycosyltransferase family 4 protein [bacterium]
MSKVLIIRTEGLPFRVRMSKVIWSILASDWECDILIPEGKLGNINIGREMGFDVSEKVRVLEYSKNKKFKSSMTKLFRGSSGVVCDKGLADYLEQLIKKVTYDVIMVKDTPALPIVFRILAKTGRKEIRVVCDMHENTPAYIYDSRIRFGNPYSRQMSILRGNVPELIAVERELLPQCDHIFVVIEEYKQHLIDKYGIEPARITVALNVEFLKFFDKIADEKLPIQSDEVILSYIGGINPFRGLDLLIEVAGKLIKNNVPPFRIYVVGASLKRRKELKKLVVKFDAEKVLTIIDFVPHNTAMNWIRQSDFGIIPHRDTELIRTTIPNKLFQYMSASVPCIVSDVGPLGRIVKENNCGLTFIPEDKDDLERVLIYAITHCNELKLLGINGRNVVEKKYKWEIAEKGYRVYFSDVKDEKIFEAVK